MSTFAEAAGDPRILLAEKYKKKVEQLQSRERIHTNAVVDALRDVESADRTADAARVAREEYMQKWSTQKVWVRNWAASARKRAASASVAPWQ